MSKHVSVISLLIYTKLKKALLVYSLMIAISLGGYYLGGFSHADTFGGGNGDLFLYLVFMAGYLLCALACIELRNKSSNQNYLYQRLRIAERTAFFWDALINAFYFLMLWAIECCILYILASRWMLSEAYIQGSQGAAVAILTNQYFHGILPSVEWSLWIRNLLYILCSGILCSSIGLASRHRKNVPICFIPFFMIGIDVMTYLGDVSYFMTFAVVAYTTMILINSCSCTQVGHRRDAHEA